MSAERGSDLEAAIALAVDAHKGQVQRNGEPYILHPLEVMRRVEGSLTKQVAVLHDVVEDTPVTLEELRVRGFEAAVIAAVGLLTKPSGCVYEDYLQRLLAAPGEAGRLARAVKLADLEHNMDVRRLSAISEGDAQRLAKYHDAYAQLRAALS